MIIFEKMNGPGVQYAKASFETIGKFQELLPGSLIKTWHTAGFCSYLNGFFWTIDPEEYTEPMHWFIPQGVDVYPILRTAFGGIIFYSSGAATLYDSDVNPEKTIHFLDPTRNRVMPLGDDLDMVFNYWLTTDSLLVSYMHFGLYEAVKLKIGGLSASECYSFTPALALGGEALLDNVEKVNLKVHLQLLSQL